MSENEISLNKQINNIQVQPMEVNAPDMQENLTRGRYEVLEQGQKLMNREYTVDGKKKSGQKKASKEMQAIFTELDGLNDVMEQMPFDVADEQSLSAVGGVVLDRMRKLMDKCDSYLISKNPWTAEGTARYRLVDRIADRLSRDIADFESKLAEFINMPQEEKARIKDWADFLNYERTASYINGQDGVTISNTEGNTSDVIVIAKNGKKQFFKKEDKLREADFTSIAREINDDIWDSVGDQEVKPGTKEYYKLAFIEAFQNEFCGIEDIRVMVAYGFKKVGTTNNHFEDLKKWCKTIKASPHGSIPRLIEKLEAITDENIRNEMQKAVGDVYTNLKKTFFSSDLATRVAKIKPGSGMAKRNIATSRLANLLHIGKLVPQSDMISITTGDKKMYGVSMGQMPGIESYVFYQKNYKKQHKGEEVKYSPEVIGELMNLQIFDAICGQTDRHVGNRMVTLEQVEKDGKKHANIMSMENKTGLSIPGMSLELAHEILALSPEMLKYEMMGILSKNEMATLIDRVTGIQEAIQKQMDYEKANPNVPTKFIAKDKWAEFQKRLVEDLDKDKALAEQLDENSYLDPDFVKGTIITEKKAD